MNLTWKIVSAIGHASAFLLNLEIVGAFGFLALAIHRWLVPKNNTLDEEAE